MGILHCSTPDFLATLAQRNLPAPSGRPFALVGEGELIWAVSPLAQIYGIVPDMPARQAQARCRDLLIYPLDLAESEAQQQAFLAELGRWELPIEPCGWGAGWIDLHSLSTQRDGVRSEEVQKLAADLGGRMRTRLGADLTPRLGWDSSKFVSRVAAHAAHTGAMRLVGKAEESYFLPPQPIALLPLPESALQQLAWLGIGTLGQYAALPAAGVWQRWGKAGRMAQDWARGKDNRPVVSSLLAAPEKIVVELDPPTERVGRVVADAMQVLSPVLARLAQDLRGVRCMDMRCGFITGPDYTQKITFVEAASDAARVQAALAQQLGKIIWHDEMERLELQIVETGELSARQLTLFAPDHGSEMQLATEVAAEVAEELSVRYGHVVALGQVIEPLHPAHDCIWKWQPL